MPTPSALYRFTRLGAGLLVLQAILGSVPRGFGQTSIVGYSTAWTGPAPSSANPFLSASTTTVVVVPFAFSAPGAYALTSATLLLSVPSTTSGQLPNGGTGPDNHGPPGGYNSADIDRTNASIQVFSTLPTSLTLPTPLVTFSTSFAGVGVSPELDLYLPDSSPTITSGSTYYLAVSLGGALEWDMTTDASSGGAYPGDDPVTSLVADGTPLVYYQITSSGVQNFYGNAGGFALAANEVAAVPEPATVGLFAGLSALTLAWWFRRRRRASAALS